MFIYYEIAVSGSVKKVGLVAYNHPIGNMYHLYTTYSPCQLDDYMLPIPPIKGTRKQVLNYYYMPLTLVQGVKWLHLAGCQFTITYRV